MMKQMRHLTTLAMAAALTTVAFAQSQTTAPQTAPAETAKPKPLAIVQGTWILTSADGQDLATGPEIALTFTDDKYAQVVNGEVVERGSLKLDETKKPMQVDLIIVEGPDAGQTQLGVLEVTGTTMRGKLNAPGDNVRPTDFEPADGFFAFTAKKR